MKSIAKLVQWNVRVAVIALKEPVVQRVEEIPETGIFFPADRKCGETAMGRRGSERQPGDVKYDVDRVRRQKQMNQHRA